MADIKVVELFAGVGGFRVGLERISSDGESKFNVVWSNQWEPGELKQYASKVYMARWPESNHSNENICDVLHLPCKKVDLLVGGFPCQDVSLPGARRGLKHGTRSGLWSEFVKAIEIIKPRLVVIENVRGLLTATAGGSLEHCAWCVGDEPDKSALRALGAVLGSLADIGYDARWQGVRAADAGAPHNRYRIFIVAYPNK
jgi:DNA (cytosine-5)-methyltransferase 1